VIYLKATFLVAGIPPHRIKMAPLKRGIYKNVLYDPPSLRGGLLYFSLGGDGVEGFLIINFKFYPPSPACGRQEGG
jgi:hypothetical protein